MRRYENEKVENRRREYEVVGLNKAHAIYKFTFCIIKAVTTTSEEAEVGGRKAISG